MKEDGSEPRRLTRRKYYGADSPHFTADGKSVIYSGMTNNYPAPSHSLLLAVAADGSQPPQILGPEPPVTGTSGPYPLGIGAWVSDPNIAWDGNTVAFFSDRSSSFSYDLFVMGRAGTEAKPLGITRISKYNTNAVFLPDGRAILFHAGTEKNAFSRAIFSLWRVDADGSNPRRMAESGLFTDPLHWSPPAGKARPFVTEPPGTGPQR